MKIKSKINELQTYVCPGCNYEQDKISHLNICFNKMKKTDKDLDETEFIELNKVFKLVKKYKLSQLENFENISDLEKYIIPEIIKNDINDIKYPIILLLNKFFYGEDVKQYILNYYNLSFSESI